MNGDQDRLPVILCLREGCGIEGLRTLRRKPVSAQRRWRRSGLSGVTAWASPSCLSEDRGEYLLAQSRLEWISKLSPRHSHLVYPSQMIKRVRRKLVSHRRLWQSRGLELPDQLFNRARTTETQCECGNKEFGISGRDRPPPSIHVRVCSAACSINWSAREKS